MLKGRLNSLSAAFRVECHPGLLASWLSCVVTVNIPIDELEARAVNELSPDSLVVIRCNCNDSQLKDLARTTLSRQGFKKLFVLIE